MPVLVPFFWGGRHLFPLILWSAGRPLAAQTAQLTFSAVQAFALCPSLPHRKQSSERSTLDGQFSRVWPVEKHL